MQIPWNKMTDEDRIEAFWAKTRKVESGCIEWTGSRNPQGYGYFGYKGKVCRSHRVAWDITFGPIPNEIKVCHKCDNPPCVNPEHLFLGTQSDNIYDMVTKNRHRSPCPRFGDDNPVSVLNSDQVREIRAIGLSMTGRAVAKQFGVSPMTISRIRNNQLWKHL